MKGERHLLKHSMPKSIIPVMAKLFSTVPYNRIRGQLENKLEEEQCGFGKERGCDDVVHALRMIVGKSAEWGEELWLATLDVEKAFDRVYCA
eukprot:1245039-Pyramimonas_sp.AAC.1